MSRVVLALPLLLLLAPAATTAEVVSVWSWSEGLWLPGRYSVVGIETEGGPESVRVRLGEGHETAALRVEANRWMAPVLPRADVAAIEVDAGAGWTRHPLTLRRAAAPPTDPELVPWAVFWDLARAASTDEVLPDATVISRVLHREILDASVPREHVGLPVIVVVGALLASLAWLSFARGRRFPVVGGRLFALFLIVPAASVLVGYARSAPISVRAIAVSSVSHRTTWDLLVLAGRRPTSVEIEARAPGASIDADRSALVRPLPDPDGRWPDAFRIEAGGHGVAGLTVGGAYRRYVVVEDGEAGPMGDPMEGPLEDAFWSFGQEAVWIGRVEAGARPTEPPAGPRAPILDVLDRIEGRRGAIVRRIGRPAKRPGLYGFRSGEGGRSFPYLLRTVPSGERLERVEHLVVP